MTKTKLPRIFLLSLCLSLTAISQAADNEMPQLPDWQVLEFEEKAFWATARSRLEILPVADDDTLWQLSVASSVVNNSEQLVVSFDPVTGRALSRSRFSRGKEQRVKSYRYETDFIVRERANASSDPQVPPEDWPVTSSRHVRYPAAATDTVVTSPYLLILLAQRLQTQEPGDSINVLVHTDLSFYRVRLTCGNGIPIEADYTVNGGGNISGRRDTLAVALTVTPSDPQEKKSDFSLLGLQQEIILFFDRDTGLLLQVRGIAPRIGTTEINLKSVAMRDPQ